MISFSLVRFTPLSARNVPLPDGPVALNNRLNLVNRIDDHRLNPPLAKHQIISSNRLSIRVELKWNTVENGYQVLELHLKKTNDSIIHQYLTPSRTL